MQGRAVNRSRQNLHALWGCILPPNLAYANPYTFFCTRNKTTDPRKRHNALKKCRRAKI